MNCTVTSAPTPGFKNLCGAQGFRLSGWLMRTVVKLQWLITAFLWALFQMLALGQTPTTGQITGSIRDVQGAVIVNAAIQLQNTATGEKRTAASDNSGNYALTLLPVGIYELTVSSPGFAAGR